MTDALETTPGRELEPIAPEKRAHDSTLTPQEQRVIEHYVLHDSRAEAMRAAGVVLPATRRELLKAVKVYFDRPHLRTYLEDLRKHLRDRNVGLVQRVLAENDAIAFSDIGDYLTVDDQGRSILDLRKVPGSSRVIKRIKQRVIPQRGKVPPIVQTEIELYDKNVALDKGFKHLGLYQRDNQQQADNVLRLDPCSLSDEHLGRLIEALEHGVHGQRREVHGEIVGVIRDAEAVPTDAEVEPEAAEGDDAEGDTAA